MTLFLYIVWKVVTLFRGPMWVAAKDMDLVTGMRQFDLDPLEAAKVHDNIFKRVLHSMV